MNQKRLFIACFISLVATAFGFIIRAVVIDDWGTQFNLSETEKGVILGAGLYPFAISIILFSLIIDRLGYGKVMIFAFVAHIVSAIVTIFATGYASLLTGTIICALANGAVEAVINPVTATLFPKQKTHYLNILHAGWPGGLVLGGVILIAMADFGWQSKIGLILLPTVAYGLLLIGCRFPVSERSAAGVSDREMFREAGGLAAAFVAAIMVFGWFDGIAELSGLALFSQLWFKIAVIAAVGIGVGLSVGSMGRPLFFLLLVIMAPLATTELGTDAWITDIMNAEMAKVSWNAGWVLVYTSAIMFVLRFFAGPIVHKISPLGLLLVCAAIACGGLVWLSTAQGLAMIFIAATFYGFGKTFFWPTMLGVTAEQFPRGGALTLNTVGGVGMLSVGLLGGPFIGVIQDKKIDELLVERAPALHAEVAQAPKTAYMIEFRPLDGELVKAKDTLAASPTAPEAEKTKAAEDAAAIAAVRAQAKRDTLATVAIFPVIMFACYLALILYFRTRGGYKPVALAEGGAKEEKDVGDV